MTARIAFGPFELDPDRSVLLRDGAAVPIGQRAAAVLAVLASARGQAVSKADLLAGAWLGAIVEDGNLTVQVAALRKALGTTPDGQSWILTLPREGYRLLAGTAGGSHPTAPAVTVTSIRAGQPAKDPARVAAILEGLRLAGLPEG